MGDLNFGKGENYLNRYIFVQHNYVHRGHTSTKSKKARRVDMSKDLRKTLVELRDRRLLEAFMRGMNDISDELVFPSPDGGISRSPQPASYIRIVADSGWRLDCVCEGADGPQQYSGHGRHIRSSHSRHSLIALTRFGRRMWQRTRNNPQPALEDGTEIPAEVIDLIGGGGWTRTSDLRIMRPSL